MVLNELRIAMIMTIRMFEIQPAYKEWDAIKESETTLWQKLWQGQFFSFEYKPVKTVDNDRAWQTDTGGARPADAYPCRIRVVTQKETRV